MASYRDFKNDSSTSEPNFPSKFGILISPPSPPFNNNDDAPPPPSLPNFFILSKLKSTPSSSSSSSESSKMCSKSSKMSLACSHFLLANFHIFCAFRDWISGKSSSSSFLLFWFLSFLSRFFFSFLGLSLDCPSTGFDGVASSSFFASFSSKLLPSSFNFFKSNKESNVTSSSSSSSLSPPSKLPRGKICFTPPTTFSNLLLTPLPKFPNRFHSIFSPWPTSTSCMEDPSAPTSSSSGTSTLSNSLSISSSPVTNCRLASLLLVVVVVEDDVSLASSYCTVIFSFG
mmetsp:Transcript_15495/g.25020  ORF Transcript_15495/g.25020 Transcript_15495/m.25020 type:complete len:286 (-) Transcript_15495:794-1651(-)